MRYLVKKGGCEFKELKSFKSKKEAFIFCDNEVSLYEKYKKGDNFNKAFYLYVLDTKKDVLICESNYLMD